MINDYHKLNIQSKNVIEIKKTIINKNYDKTAEAIRTTLMLTNKPFEDCYFIKSLKSALAFSTEINDLNSIKYLVECFGIIEKNQMTIVEESIIL
jgi:predicted unusual protein kinase regulating ubiquinone biosynthesis (AarF/ABC1/UbiB family)